MGAAPFQRSAKGMTLTRSGQRFRFAADEILTKLEESMPATERPEVSGHLKIAATYTMIGYCLPVHLERLASPSRAWA